MKEAIVFLAGCLIAAAVTFIEVRDLRERVPQKRVEVTKRCHEN